MFEKKTIINGEKIECDKKEDIEISVCMACYNGEKYILEQLQSILIQLNDNSELIIIDDGSQDSTLDIINSFNDQRIKVYSNSKNVGVNKTFEKAITYSKGKYIFLADQDDIWTTKHLPSMLMAMKNVNGSMLVSGNIVAINEEGNLINYDFGKLLEKDEKAYKKNIIKIFQGRAYYYGCAMAFSREMKNYILPFPEYMESHDLWIAMIANVINKNRHINDNVLYRRIHESNVSIIQRNLKEKIISRIIFMRLLFEAKRRIKK